MNRGFTQIFLVLGLALVVLTIPLTVRLISERQETRKMAREDLGCGNCEKQVSKRECHNEDVSVCLRYKQECVEEKCRTESYSCTNRVCEEYEEKCESRSVPCKKPCIIGEKDDGRPIYGQCDDICDQQDCRLTNNCIREINVTDTCYREKCNQSCHDTGECEQTETTQKQVCENVSFCEPDPGCLAEGSTPPSIAPPIITPSCANGQKECNDSEGYNECVNGAWFSQSCPSGETCSSGNCAAAPVNPSNSPTPTPTPEATVSTALPLTATLTITPSPGPSLTYTTPAGTTTIQTDLTQMYKKHDELQAWCNANPDDCQKRLEQNDRELLTAGIVAPVVVAAAVTSPIWGPEAAAVIAAGGPALQTAGLISTRLASTALAEAIIMKLGNQAYQATVRPYLIQPENLRQLQAIPEPPINPFRLIKNADEETPWIIAATDSVYNLSNRVEPLVGQTGMTLAGVGPAMFYGGRGLTDIRNQQIAAQQQNSFVLDVGGPSPEKNEWFYTRNPRINININREGSPVYDDFATGTKTKIISAIRGQNQIAGNAFSLPLANNSIPIYSSNCMMDEVFCNPLFAQEAHRVLKPGGQIHISGIVHVAITPLMSEMSKTGFKNLNVWEDLYGMYTVTGYR